MASDRRTGIVVGVLFIMATVASILGAAAQGSVLDDPDYLVQIAANDTRVTLAALLYLLAATSAVATAFLLFPILRRHAEGLATGYVVFRVFENVLYAVGVVGMLVMVTVGTSGGVETAGDSAVLVGTGLSALNHWAVLVGTLIFFSIGSVVLNYVLYRWGLVPRWLSVWGLIGAVLAFIYGLLGFFGVETEMGSPYMVLAMPIALQEMVFAVWLIAKGFNQRQASAIV